MIQLEETKSIASVNLDSYDAIMVAGGQSPMFTFEDKIDLHNAFAHFYETGKIAAALCHGVAILNYVKGSNGEYIVKGKKVTGFSNEEEDQANAQVGAEIMPWRIEDELTKKGANFKKEDAWSAYATQDGNLITGQQNLSGEATALKIIEHLNKNKS
jgi:putative intracellular protease/amidase